MHHKGAFDQAYRNKRPKTAVLDIGVEVESRDTHVGLREGGGGLEGRGLLVEDDDVATETRVNDEVKLDNETGLTDGGRYLQQAQGQHRW